MSDAPEKPDRDKVPSCNQLDKRLIVQEERFKFTDERSKTTEGVVNAVKSEHDKDIAALKAEVSTLKQITYGALLMAFGSLLAAVLAFIFKK